MVVFAEIGCGEIVELALCLGQMSARIRNYLMILTRSAVALCTVLSLASCGVTYTPQTVSTKDTPLDVTVVSMSPSSIEVANRSTYTPRALPAEFFATAGMNGTMRGFGAFP